MSRTKTYEFTAFQEADLGGNVCYGHTFTMPDEATTCFSVKDDDIFLSGDHKKNENANDKKYQTASIEVDGSEVGNGGQIYAEVIWYAKGSDGKTYRLVEIEQEKASGDFFTFYNGTPPAGVTLTITGCKNVTKDFLDYKCLDAGEKDVNNAPEFTNLPADGKLAINENETFVIDADAVDADGDTLTFSITGGADSDKFEIDPATGALSFKNAPDFENPTDGNGNNIYDVTITVDDGNGGTATKKLWVMVNDVDEPTFDLDPDALTVCEDDPATSIDLTANDVIPEGSTIELLNAGGIPGGSISLSPEGVLTFDPGQDFQSLKQGESVSFDVEYKVTAPAGPAEPIVVEAEDLYLDGFKVVHGSQASGGELVKIKSKDAHAELKDFSGEDGKYDISLFIQDETDGKSKIMVSVDGTAVEAFRLDRQSDGGGSNNGSFSEFVIRNVDIEKGDNVKVSAWKDGYEFVRFDKIEFTPVGEVTLGAELIVNGDFEDHPSLQYGSWGLFNSIPGWVAIRDKIEIQEGSHQTGNAAGNSVVELDANNNAIICQEVNVTEAGSYRFSVDYAMRGTNADTNGFQVFINGKLQATVNPTQPGFQNLTFDIDLEAGINRVDLKGIGKSDCIGTVIDNVSLRQITPVDPMGEMQTETVTITVEGKNDGPLAVADTLVTDEDTPIGDDLLANDSDIDGDPLTITAVSGGTVGTAFTATSAGGRDATVLVTSAGAVNVLFDPNGRFEDLGVGESDSVTFTYTISDGNGGTSSADATITVNGVNDGPTANADTLDTDEDTPVTGDLLLNDTDPEGDNLTITAIQGGTVGTAFTATSAGGRQASVIVFAGGAVNIIFDPNSGFEDLNDGESDSVTLTYTISDGNGGTDTAEVTINVAGVTDNTPPIIAEPVVFFAPENQTFAGDLQGIDPDGDVLTFAIVGGDDADLFDIDSATGVLTFKNAPDFENPVDTGNDNSYDLRVEVSDGQASSASDVKVNVTDVNEAPTANDDTLRTDEDTPAAGNLLGNDTDPDSDTLTITAVAGGTVGTAFTATSAGGRDASVLIFAGGAVNILFDPNGGFEDLDDGDTDTITLTYTVSDGNGGTDTADVVITVDGITDNSPPIIAEPVVFEVDENQTFAGVINGQDADGDTLTYSISGGVDAALFQIDSGTGELTFLNAPDFETPLDDGADNRYDVQVSVSDGELSSANDIRVRVLDVNENSAPVLVQEGSTAPLGATVFATASDNQAILFDFDALDADGDTILYSLAGPDAGALEIDALGRVFAVGGDPLTPAIVGADGFVNVTVIADDQNGGTDEVDLFVTLTTVG